MTPSTLPPSLSPYDLGATPATACAMDQRFSYCLYVPREGDPATRRLLVAVHGTGRGNQVVRDSFTALADQLNLIILAPLFPCGIDDPNDRDNYKYVEYRGIRFDHVLLAMIDEVATKYGVADTCFGLFGFSGGAHFAHRFYYLYPERLSAVSVCAPGSPTLPDPDRPWWVGVADMEARFGRPLNLPAMRSVPVHLAVGTRDVETWEITHRPGSAHWMEGANDTGSTRVERIGTLHAALRASDIAVRLDLVEGVAHEYEPLARRAMTFFAETLGDAAR